MSSTMKDGARLCAVAFSPAPVHVKGFAFMYCHHDLRGGEIPALDGARPSVSERDRSRTHMLLESEPSGWFAHGKVDQVMLQVLTTHRSHPSLPTDRREPLNSYLAAGATALF